MLWDYTSIDTYWPSLLQCGAAAVVQWRDLLPTLGTGYMSCVNRENVSRKYGGGLILPMFVQLVTSSEAGRPSATPLFFLLPPQTSSLWIRAGDPARARDSASGCARRVGVYTPVFRQAPPSCAEIRWAAPDSSFTPRDEQLPFAERSLEEELKLRHREARVGGRRVFSRRSRRSCVRSVCVEESAVALWGCVKSSLMLNVLSL
ncbi:hypothetical protein AOLI_G00023950 [Acnodon oligacanthus]